MLLLICLILHSLLWSHNSKKKNNCHQVEVMIKLLRFFNLLSGEGQHCCVLMIFCRQFRCKIKSPTASKHHSVFCSPLHICRCSAKRSLLLFKFMLTLANPTLIPCFCSSFPFPHTSCLHINRGGGKTTTVKQP